MNAIEYFQKNRTYCLNFIYENRDLKNMSFNDNMFRVICIPIHKKHITICLFILEYIKEMTFYDKQYIYCFRDGRTILLKYKMSDPLKCKEILFKYISHKFLSPTYNMFKCNKINNIHFHF